MEGAGQRYGLLSYSTFNLGDQIQSIAARRFLPSIDCFIDREKLDEVAASEQSVKLIMNGWYCHDATRWPPAPAIQPLIVSFHVSDIPGHHFGIRAREFFRNSSKVLDYLRRHGPVGARDRSTEDLLKSWGVDAYFSGCLTLTLQAPPVVPDRDLIVLCDVPDEVASRLAGQNLKFIRTKHRDEVTHGIEARFVQAENLLAIYAKASCVITPRLHCALPCLAMGTPVLLLDAAPDKYRFTGLTDLVHNCSVEEMLDGSDRFDPANPPPNPIKHQALRSALIERVEQFIRH
jgi:hypothetical protein